METPPRVLELTVEEVEILLRWAERATRGVCPGRERYLSEAEARLLARLEQLRPAVVPEAQEDG
jgi:hypothetical protein